MSKSLRTVRSVSFGAAVGVGGVDARGAVAGDLDAQVARDREQRRRAAVRVQAHEDQRVRARRVALDLVLVALVGADHEDRLRTAAVDVVEDVLDARDDLALGAHDVDEVLDLEQHRRGHGRRRQQQDQDAGEEALLEHAATWARRLFEDRGSRRGVNARGGAGLRAAQHERRPQVSGGSRRTPPVAAPLFAVADGAQAAASCGGSGELRGQAPHEVAERLRGSASARTARPTRPVRGGPRRSARTRPPGCRPRGTRSRPTRRRARPTARRPRRELSTASRSASTYGFVRETIAGARSKQRTISTSRDRPYLGEDRAAILAGQVADVDVHPAAVGDLVEGVAAVDPREVDRRAVEEVRGLAAERQRLDAAEDVVRLEDRVVAEPRRRAVRGDAADLDRDREHALGLDADVQLGRLAGDREVGACRAPRARAGRSSGPRRPRTPRRARRRSARARRPARRRRGRRTSSPRARPSCRTRRARSAGRPRRAA